MNNKNKTRVFIADDHALVREGLKRLLEENEFIICGESADGIEALEKIKIAQPDLAIIDLTMPGLGGIELIKNLKMKFPRLLILVVSMHDETVYAERALKAGARGYIMKKESAEKIIPAILRILSGKIFVSENISERMLENLSDGHFDGKNSLMDQLSDRELEIFNLIGQGLKTSEIATQLHLSPRTVESYREQIKLKLNLEDASELVRTAIEWAKSQSNG